MKQKLIFLALFLISGLLYAQVPQKFNYQAVARDASGNLLANQNLTFRISILQGSVNGTLVYQETHQKTTNAYGQVTLIIGSGTVLSGNFNTINWGANSYYIKTEMKPTGGFDFLLMGTSQLLSVPYALYSNASANGFSGNYNDLTNKPTLFSGAYVDLTGKPASWDSTWVSIKNKPAFFDGQYNSLSGKPILFDGTWNSLTGKPSLATVATSGSYTDLSNKPTIPAAQV
ncbi:MAG: hypothetical protein WCH34_18525, partial [Bacteroidota bacterium]